MRPLREVIEEFRQGGKALGHFNFSDSNQLKAIAEASKETGLPIIAGLSEGERGHFPFSHAVPLVQAYQKEGVQLYLNADHTYSTDLVQRAISAGVDSVVVDGAKLPYPDNAEMLKLCVKYARASGRDVIVDGELGYIGTSSSVMESLPEGVTLENLTTPEEAKKLIAETGIDCLAPAVGNVHGMLKNAKEPKLHPERVKEIADATDVPLVLHGASGNTDEDVRACIKSGVAIVHINTEFRLTYHDALKETLESSGETTPYKFLTPAEQKMKEFLIAKVRLFANP